MLSIQGSSARRARSSASLARSKTTSTFSPSPTRAAQHDDALLDQRVHERRVLVPAILLAARSRRVPGGSAGLLDQEVLGHARQGYAWPLQPAGATIEHLREQMAVDCQQPVDVVDVAVELGNDDRVALAGLARTAARSPPRRASASARASPRSARPSRASLSPSFGREQRGDAARSGSRSPARRAVHAVDDQAAERASPPRAACRGRRSPPRPARARAR